MPQVLTHDRPPDNSSEHTAKHISSILTGILRSRTLVETLARKHHLGFQPIKVRYSLFSECIRSKQYVFLSQLFISNVFYGGKLTAEGDDITCMENLLWGHYFVLKIIVP